MTPKPLVIVSKKSCACACFARSAENRAASSGKGRSARQFHRSGDPSLSNEKERAPTFLEQMVGGLAEQQRFAGPYGHAQNDQRRSLPLGLLENGVSPVRRRSAENAHALIAVVGDFGDLPERRLLVPARKRASASRPGRVRDEEDRELRPRRAREFDCDFCGVTGIRCAGHEREDLQGRRCRIAFMHARGRSPPPEDLRTNVRMRRFPG